MSLTSFGVMSGNERTVLIIILGYRLCYCSDCQYILAVKLVCYSHLRVNHL